MSTSGPTLLQREVVQAYAPWMEQKKKEVIAYFDDERTPAAYKDFVKSLFNQLDQDGSGIVNKEELLAWAEKNTHGSRAVPSQYISDQFNRVDLDGSGGLDFDECLLLQYLGCLNMLWCGACGAFIDVGTEDGFTCASCYGKFGRDGRQRDVCVKCFNEGAADKHMQDLGDSHSFVRISEIKAVETVVCVCCQQSHSMVPGYMQGLLGDKHVRPVGDDPNTWVCELCALTTCGGGGCLAWRKEGFVDGGLFGPAMAPCQAGGACATLVLPPVRDRWVQASSYRIAPHCITCKENMLAGTLPGFKIAEPELLPCVADVATAVSGHLNAESMATQTTMVPNIAGLQISTQGGALEEVASPRVKQAVCYCCQDVHDLNSALDGKPIPGYFYASGFAEHVKLMPDGRYLCEWCAKQICERCGTHTTDIDNPSLAKWSQFIKEKDCEPMKWGGWGSVRAGLRTKASDLTRGHCRACRQKIVTGSLLDLSSRATDVGAVRQAVCYCCQRTHDMNDPRDGSAIPAYLQMAEFDTHLKELSDGRFVCEWCSKWMCHKCGTPKWTDQRPELGLWSERSYYCKAGCAAKENGPHHWDKARLRANSHDLGRAHCRDCREKVIMGTLAERQSRQSKDVISAGGASMSSTSSDMASSRPATGSRAMGKVGKGTMAKQRVGEEIRKVDTDKCSVQ